MVPALTVAVPASSASASSLTSLRAEAASIAAQINAAGLQEAALSEQYDAATLALAQTRAEVATARREVAAADLRAGQARAVLVAEALNAYMSSGASASAGVAPSSGSLSSANASLLRAEYTQTLAADQADLQDRYTLDSRLAASAETTLTSKEHAQSADVASLASAHVQVVALQQRLQNLEAGVTGRIASLVAQYQAAQRQHQLVLARERFAAWKHAQEVAAQQAAQQAAARAQAAQTQAYTPPAASTPTASGGGGTGGGGGAGGGGAGGGGGAPPVSSAAAIAVRAAESRVGDPYVWGAAGPNSFDCSGLVMWAYAQAGIYLPHYSGAQYADTVHIPMSDLQPGDLVFFANPGQHVAMYVGNGEVVQAPYTGANVEIVPLYSGFVLASRVE